MNEQKNNGDCEIGKVEIRYFDPVDEPDIDCTIKAYQYLSDNGIEVNSFEKLSGQRIEIFNLKTIKVDFLIREIATGEFASKRELPEGAILEAPYLEFAYDDEQMEKFANSDIGEFEGMAEVSREAYNLLIDYFSNFNMQLISATLWFAKDEFGNVYLASDITPEMVEVWDKKTNLPFQNKSDIYKRILG